MKLTFGKHEGKELSEVATNHPSYLYTLIMNADDEFKETNLHEQAEVEFWKGNQPMPFGKFQGTPIKDIDSNYLKWLYPKLEEGWLKSVIATILFLNNTA
jgi:uncharacterized protein (DUF3820 family)